MGAAGRHIVFGVAPPPVPVELPLHIRQKDIKLLERVRQRATKVVHGITDLKYRDQLKCLGLARLENRRLRSDINETYNIVNGNYSIDRDLFFHTNNTGLRGHDSKLFKRRLRLCQEIFI